MWKETSKYKDENDWVFASESKNGSSPLWPGILKVVQELMRHASTRFTLEIYSLAQLIAKRTAQQRLLQAILPEEVVNSLPPVVAENRVSGLNAPRAFLELPRAADL